MNIILCKCKKKGKRQVILKKAIDPRFLFGECKACGKKYVEKCLNFRGGVMNKIKT